MEFIPAGRKQARSVASQIREREILRTAGALSGASPQDSAQLAIDEVLRWAQVKAAGKFPLEAWRHESFEQLSSGRSRVAVSQKVEDKVIWALRAEDPDRSVPGRSWTTEIVVSWSQQEARCTVRLLASSPEESLSIEPHVPGIVRQIVANPGLESGIFKILDRALTIRSQDQAKVLADALIDPRRTLPIIVLTVSTASADPFKPPFDAEKLAKACAGLATVLVLPAAFTWTLTERYGKRLAVYEGAARIYLPGFSADANPFGGHELVFPQQSPSVEDVALNRLRWMAANASTRRLILGKDLIAFGSLRLRLLEARQAELQITGATERERLEAANQAIENLKTQVIESERYQQQFSDMHDAAEERAETAETQLNAAGFRIQQLLVQLKAEGAVPDANLPLPSGWPVLADWCDQNLAGRVILTPQARRMIKDPEFLDYQLVAKCLLWLANEYHADRVNGGEGSVRERVIVDGVINSHCGNDAFDFRWQERKYSVDWHIKSGGNSRDPSRCLRIYYFWDEQSQQSVIASLPAHRRTDAT